MTKLAVPKSPCVKPEEEVFARPNHLNHFVSVTVGTEGPEGHNDPATVNINGLLV